MNTFSEFALIDWDIFLQKKSWKLNLPIAKGITQVTEILR